MPTTTFNNLDEEKRNKIILAARKEFSTVLYNEASINKIIKEAEISRGSFYMYFEDKKDLYLYVVDEFRENLKAKFRVILETENDIFKSFEKLFTIGIKFLMSGQNKKMFKNIFLNIHLQDEMSVGNIEKDEKLYKSIFSLISATYPLLSNDDIEALMEAILLLTIHNIACTVKNNHDLKIQTKKYVNQLDILKRGIENKGEING